MLNEEAVAWSLFRDGSDPILIENLDGIVIDLNREAERAYGWSRDEFDRRTDPDPRTARSATSRRASCCIDADLERKSATSRG